MRHDVGQQPARDVRGQGAVRARGRRDGRRRDVEPHRPRSAVARSRTAWPRRAGRARRCPDAPRARRSAGAPRRRRCRRRPGRAPRRRRPRRRPRPPRSPCPGPAGCALSATTRRPGGVQPSSVAGGPERAHDQVRLVGRQLARAHAVDRHLEARREDGELEDVVAASARPAQSNAGPRLALVAGTRTRTGPHRPSWAAAAAASTGMVRGAGAPRSPTPGP